MGKGVNQTVTGGTQIDRDYAEEIYCAAWALVLARQAGLSDEVRDVRFGCMVEGLHNSLFTLHLSFSGETEIGAFLCQVRQTVGGVASAEQASGKTPPGSLPFPNILSIGGSESLPPSHTITGDAVIIHCVASRIQAYRNDAASESAHIDILVAQLQQTIRQLQTLPLSTPLQKVDIFSDEDRQTILHWNQEPPSYVDETLCSLFSRHVRLHPSAPAVCSWDRDLSYAEVDVLSEKLAGELAKKGVHPEETIALCLNKSSLAVVVMMAVLRTGACFVNLGISTPAQRQTAILSACKASLLIVDKSNASRLVEHDSVPGLLVDDQFVADLPKPTTPLPVVAPNYAAAITFTSGSTGAPKGIVVEHGSIATSCKAMSDRLGVGPGTRILQFASYTFDASVGDIFYALSRGACVCVPSEKERVDDLAAAARRLQVNWAFLTPSVLSLLIPSDIPSLRRLLLGGEKPSPYHVDLWAQNVSLHLVMGPAECAIYCAASDAVRPGQDPTTFGRAVGCRMWIVEPDDHTKLVPVGCPGELVVEGRIVSRGYLNDPKRTSKSFLDDTPWLPPSASSSPSVRRLYKSGDLVRFNPSDGTFSFVARKDNQVKLHGQRVELEEVEHNIKNVIPDVDSALALLNTSGGQSSRHALVVFLVFTKDSTIVKYTEGPTMKLSSQGTEMLRKSRSQLENLLPTYMIPTLFVPLHNVPFNLNGKRDVARLRQILQGLSKDELHRFSLAEEPITRTLSSQEDRLRGLWIEILHVEPSEIGPDSDFIRQGGDSLAAMHLVSAATKAGFHLPVSIIMSYSSLSGMAAQMSQLSSQEQGLRLSPFSLLPTTVSLKSYCAFVCNVDLDQIEDIYPITPLQDMLWNASLRRPGTYILRMRYQLPPTILLQAFMSAWDQVLQSTEIFRTRFVSGDQAGLVQVVIKGFKWDLYENIDEYEHDKHNISVSSGARLARLAIIRSTPGQTPIFVFTAHHVLYDAFALTMMFEKVAQIYQTVSYTLGFAIEQHIELSFRAHTPFSLPSKTTYHT